jgi:hypothetical protein
VLAKTYETKKPSVVAPMELARVVGARDVGRGAVAAVAAVAKPAVTAVASNVQIEVTVRRHLQTH